MANELVVFRKGLSSEIPSEVVPGTLLAEIDTGNAYLDTKEHDRVQLTDTRKLSLSGGTMTGPINMGNQKITNLGNPTQNTDAANKIFVDTAFQELESTINQELLTYLPLKGSTMAGAIDMGDYKITSLGTPTDGTDATNKTYVDNAISDAPYLNTSGVTPMAGNLNMSNHRISNLLNPSNPQDAATKNYVDSAIGGITGFTVDSNGGNGYANYGALTSAHPTGEVGVFYLVVNPDSSAPNAFDEYFWTGTGYEKAGGFGDVDTSDLATKAELSKYLPLSGGTMTGNLTMGNRRITGLPTPSANSDAATKQYVDNALADIQIPSSTANQFLTATAATTSTKAITGRRPSSGSVFFVLFQNGVTASSGTFTFSFSTGGTCTVSGGSGFPAMPTIAMSAWTMGTFYMNSATTAKFIAYTNYIDDGVVS